MQRTQNNQQLVPHDACLIIEHWYSVTVEGPVESPSWSLIPTHTVNILCTMVEANPFVVKKRR